MSANNKVTSPRDGEIIYKNSSSEPLEIEVSGTATEVKDTREHTIDNITVTIGGGEPKHATYDKPDHWPSDCDPSCERTFSWYAKKSITDTGDINISVNWTVPPQNTPNSINRRVTVNVDTIRPTFTIAEPAQNKEIPIPESGTSIELKINASDVGVGVVDVVCRLEGEGEVHAEKRSSGGGGNWNWLAKVPIPLKAIGNKSISVHCKDVAGNLSLPQTLSFIGRDVTPPHPPHVKINSPMDGYEHPQGAKLIVRGEAKDLQSKIAALEWRLDNQPPFMPVPVPWENWSLEIEADQLAPGPHSLEIRCQDTAGNWSSPHPELVVTFQVADIYIPQNLVDLVSLPAYLLDLLWFGRNRINTDYPSLGAQLKDADLENLLYQPFRRLGDILTKRASESVNQLRPCIEVLRRFLGSDHLSEGLVGYWRFEEREGEEVAYDSSEHAHDAFLKGPQRTSERRSGHALEFDGNDDYVRVLSDPQPVISPFEMSNVLTMCAWIFPTGPGNGIIGEGGIIVNKEGEYGLARFADGTIRWAFANKEPGWRWTSTDSIAPLNAWTHVGVVYDHGQIRTYLNGVLVHKFEGAGQITDWHVEWQELRIGGRQKAPHHFQGKIDEVRIYRRALSNDAVAHIAEVSHSPAHLLAHWRFDEGKEDTLADSTGNKHTGTRIGASWTSGRVGSALLFDGKSNHVLIQGSERLR